MLTKNKVIQTITRLPDKFSLDELLGEMKRLEEIEKHYERYDSGNDSDDSRFQESFQWFG